MVKKTIKKAQGEVKPVAAPPSRKVDSQFSQKKQKGLNPKKVPGRPVVVPIVVEAPIVVEEPVVIQPVVEAKPFELGRRTGSSCGVGMPKSGKPWKILSERSAKNKKYAPLTWEK